uniref:Uncharacterized protein n=1 Tax=Arundo donax TaxID=35708 RepID=A0A0A8Y6B3_ARUDO
MLVRSSTYTSVMLAYFTYT